MGSRSSGKALKEVEIFEFSKVSTFTPKEINDFFLYYRLWSSSQKDDGVIDYQQFLQALHLQDCALSKRLFMLFDTNNDQVINFREFLIAFSNFINDSTATQIAVTFRFFEDREHRGFIRMDIFKDLLLDCMRLLPNLKLPEPVIVGILDKTMSDILELKSRMAVQRKNNPQQRRKILHDSSSNLPSRKFTQSSLSSQNLYFNRRASSSSAGFLDLPQMPSPGRSSDIQTVESPSESPGLSPAYPILEPNITEEIGEGTLQGMKRDLGRDFKSSAFPYDSQVKGGGILRIERTEIEKGGSSNSLQDNAELSNKGSSKDVFEMKVEKKFVQSNLGDSPGVSSTFDQEGECKMETTEPKIQYMQQQNTDQDMASFDGYLDYETYSRLVEENPAILRWFTIDLHRVEHWAKYLKK